MLVRRHAAVTTESIENLSIEPPSLSLALTAESQAVLHASQRPSTVVPVGGNVSRPGRTMEASRVGGVIARILAPLDDVRPSPHAHEPAC